MWKLRKNIDLAQINLNNADGKFYLPENVDFRDKVIDEIIFVCDDKNIGARSPFDGRELVSGDELGNFYIELINDERKVFFEQVSAINCSAYQNAPLPINSKISLKLSNINYVGTQDVSAKCILLYVVYSTAAATEDELPTNSVSKTITIPAGTSSVNLSDYIDDYIRRIGARVRAIEADTNAPFYLDLQTKNGNLFRMVASQIFDTDKSKPHAQPLLLDEFDVDFKNSKIFPAQTETATNIVLTFYY